MSPKRDRCILIHSPLALFFFKDIDLENVKKELVSLDIDEKCISIRDDSLEWNSIIETDGPEGA